MNLIRLRWMGNDDDARGLIDLLTSIDGVERVEEIADLMPHLDDEDSSSAGLESDRGLRTYLIEVEVPNATAAARVRLLAQGLAGESGAGVEFEEDEPWGDSDRNATPTRLH